jgi:hypothetical protein
MKRFISILLLIVMVGHSSMGLLKLAGASTEMVMEIDVKKDKNGGDGKESKEFIGLPLVKPEIIPQLSVLFHAESHSLAPSPVLHKQTPPPDSFL